VSALEACVCEYPGFQGVDVAESEPGIDEPYIYHFPDGNASVARLLVRKLIPQTALGSTMEDIVLAKFDYTLLDRQNSNVRIRLGHALNFAANVGNEHVDLGVTSVDGIQKRVRTKHCILACFNMAIRYIVPELSTEQKLALSSNVKAPLVYTNVAVRNWKPWVKLGVHEVFGVDTFHVRIKLDYAVTMGGHSSAKHPEEPALIHMVHVPSVNDDDVRASLRAARNTLFSLKFEDFAERVKSDLNRVFGSSGFNAETDIAGIIVNRWSHGYSYSANSLAESNEQAEQMKLLARKKIGNIAIACSDSGWSAYAHSAVDEAYRAVQELAEPR
jgi:spermidine dehydrogenase